MTPPPIPPRHRAGEYPPAGDPYAPRYAPSEPVQGNPMGTAGFILSLVMLLFWWTPYAGFLLWVLAVVFSAVGLNRKPRGLAIAGLIIAVAVPLLLVFLCVAIIGSFAAIDACNI